MTPSDDRQRPAGDDDASCDSRSTNDRSIDDHSTDDRAAAAGMVDERSVDAAAARSRRRFLAATGTAGVLALAGCSAEPTGNGDDDPSTEDTGDDGNGEDEGTADEEGDGDGDGNGDAPTLTVATYESFVDAPSTSPGEWIREAFAERHGVEIEWATPSNGVNHYVERRASGAEIDADLFVGLTTDDLVRVDRALDDTLFAADAFADVEATDDVRDGLWFDPRNRVVPYATNYVSLVYDGTETAAPATFEGLLEEEHRGALITQNPGGSTTGRAFLLHTVHRFGADDLAGGGGGDGEDGYDYLDFWADLQDNDVRVLGSWNDAYAAWSGGEAPMVVSYSTDQVFAAAEGADLAGHQVRFLDDQAYANPEGAALFADADEPELARELLAFLLEPEVQGEIAQRNVQFPATTTADLDDDYAELAKEPAEPVTFTYEELAGSVEGWIEAWERQFAGN